MLQPNPENITEKEVTEFIIQFIIPGMIDKGGNAGIRERVQKRQKHYYRADTEAVKALMENEIL